MAPVIVVPEEEEGPLLLDVDVDVGDEHAIDVTNETVEEEETVPSTTLLPQTTLPPQTDGAWISESSKVLIQVCMITLLFDFTQYSSYAPLTAVFEEIICNHYYPPGSALRDCKSVPVQSELALVKGYKDAFNQIPSIILGIPLGLLADRIGRKPFIILFLLGFFLSDSWTKIVCLFPQHLPLRLVWFAPVLKAFGGGANFGTSMFYTVVADIMEEKHRGDAFMKLSGMEMVVLVAGVPLISILMRLNSWYPLGLSTICLIAAGAIALTLPETHPQHRTTNFGLPKSVEGEAQDEDVPMAESHLVTLRKLLPRAFTTLRDLLKDTGILLSLAVFLLVAFGAHVWALLLQYVAHKFEWEFSTANLLFSLRGAITLLLSLVIMRMIDKFLQKKLGIKAAQKDLLLCTGSCILIIVGIALVGVAQSPVLMIAGVVISALGSSLLVSLRSAIISLFPQTPMASLNAIAGIAQSVGILISGPVLAQIYSWGLSKGGFWFGTPFLVASGLHVVALADIFYLRLTRVSAQASST